MFDLSYRKTMNKRRSWGRGRKKRYAVYRAEANIAIEARNKMLCEDYCERHNLNINDIKIQHPDRPWTMTFEYIKILNRSFPYHLNDYILRYFPQEYIQVLKNNIEIAEQYRKSKVEN